MKHYFLLIWVLLYGFKGWTQNDAGIFSQIKQIQQQLPKKYTLVYVFVNWCGGNAEDIKAIQPVLNEFRNKYNLIVLIDSTKKEKISPLILDLKPEAYVPLNTYYPSCFFKKKDNRKAAMDFNKIFGTNKEFLGPGSLYMQDCDYNLLPTIFVMDRPEQLRHTLISIPESCAKNDSVNLK